MTRYVYVVLMSNEDMTHQHDLRWLMLQNLGRVSGWVGVSPYKTNQHFKVASRDH